MRKPSENQSARFKKPFFSILLWSWGNYLQWSYFLPAAFNLITTIFEVCRHCYGRQWTIVFAWAIINETTSINHTWTKTQTVWTHICTTKIHLEVVQPCFILRHTNPIDCSLQKSSCRNYSDLKVSSSVLMTAGSSEGNCWVTQFSSFNQPDSIVQQQQQLLPPTPFPPPTPCPQGGGSGGKGGKSSFGLINERDFLQERLQVWGEAADGCVL